MHVQNIFDIVVFDSSLMDDPNAAKTANKKDTTSKKKNNYWAKPYYAYYGKTKANELTSWEQEAR